jgi:hypothetical protein
MSKFPAPAELLRAKVTTARNVLVRGATDNASIDSAVRNLKQAVWAWESYQGERKKARVVIGSIAEALVELYLARTARYMGERREHFDWATSLVVDAWEVLQTKR